MPDDKQIEEQERMKAKAEEVAFQLVDQMAIFTVQMLNLTSAVIGRVLTMSISEIEKMLDEKIAAMQERPRVPDTEAEGVPDTEAEDWCPKCDKVTKHHIWNYDRQEPI
jgi:predicted nucleic acid-binding protein